MLEVMALKHRNFFNTSDIEQMKVFEVAIVNLASNLECLSSEQGKLSSQYKRDIEISACHTRDHKLSD